MQRKGTNWKLPFGLGLAVLVVVTKPGTRALAITYTWMMARVLS